MPPAQKNRPKESNLVAHARRELRIIGEDPDTINDMCHIVQAFADMGPLGINAQHCAAYLDKLLRHQPLSDLTDDPSEWINRYAEGFTTKPLWQSKRNPEAFSTDGGKTYILLSEQQVSGDTTTAPLHRSTVMPQSAEPVEAGH
ncbi:hypothetical protein ACIQUW_32950 [Streptomyces sp. NPDC101117]|uniref:hypothetical protein n=1 Tax=Streptomyces sp. NPDC101117 TaxID=3366108 RepID=UPI0038019204